MFTGCWTLHILQALTFGLKLVFAYQSGDECSVLLLPQFIRSSAASTTWIFGVYLVWLWPTEIHGATLKKLLTEFHFWCCVLCFNPLLGSSIMLSNILDF